MTEEREGTKAGAKMKLIVQRGGSRGKVFDIEEGSNLIGRWDPDEGAFPEIDLESEDEEAKVSRKHAVVVRTGMQVTLEDIGSKNGTFLNRGPRLVQGAPQTLAHGDEVVVGKTVMKFEVES